MGNSASLDEMDLDEFDGFTTIGVNRILRLYEPTYVMIVDGSVIQQEYSRLGAYRGKVLLYPGAMNTRMQQLYPGPWISTGYMSGTADVCSKKGDIHIPSRGNSAYEAAHIAMRMGAKRIAFAGVDMYYPPLKKTHFFGMGAKEGCSMSKVEEIINCFAEMKRSYKCMGIDVVSVSPWNTPLRQRLGYIPLSEL